MRRRSFSCRKLLQLWLVCWCSVRAAAAEAPPQTTDRPTVPIVDLRPWTTPSLYAEEDRQAVVKEIQTACETIGFFGITGHAVPSTVLNEMLGASRAFFDLPSSVKQQYKTNDETTYPYGYEHSETLSHSKYADQKASVPDPKETFSMGPYNPDSGMPPRRLPDAPTEMAHALEQYYLAMERLANVLLEIFALALNLPQNWFEDKMDRHLSALRLLNYPELTMDSESPRIRASPHTDYGVLTILYSGGPGLQVQPDATTNRSVDDSWTDVPDLPDTFVINLGDLMQRWTNGTYLRSKQHKVQYFTHDSSNALRFCW